MSEFGDSLRSPTKSTGTSKVIESLHEHINSYAQKLDESNLELNEYKRKYGTVQKRLNSVTDQLENSKYQQDTMSAILRRKECKIADMEQEAAETLARLDTAEAELANLKKQLNDSKQKESQERHELERMRTAYETISEGQEDYRRHYEREINRLRTSFDLFVLDNQRMLQENVDSLKNTNVDLGKAFSTLKTNMKKVERSSLSKDESASKALKKLALEAKGNDIQIMKVLIECEDVLGQSLFDLTRFPSTVEYRRRLQERLEAKDLNSVEDSIADHASTTEAGGTQTSSNNKKEKKNSSRGAKASDPNHQHGIDVFKLRNGAKTPQLGIKSTSTVSEPRSYSCENTDTSYDNGKSESEQTESTETPPQRKRSVRRRQRKRKNPRKVSKNEKSSPSLIPESPQL